MSERREPSESDPILEQANRAAHRLSRVVVNALELQEDGSFTLPSVAEYQQLAQAAREYEELDRLARAEATR